ncbi:MAG: 23S rRNA (guanosine(2251)-2'-O)-methyltransferase RlmB [Chloroflexi bacterium RBG_16_57_11]|nr:MAG: 23S rRNA (guanosine(2251)-2'-O)-methyltransferase RlmB [Chloroflexi bacterium RBG_16_57_11]
MREWISGRNPVYETLQAGRRHCFCLIVAQGTQEKGRLAEILQVSQKKRIPIEQVPRARLDAISDGHQGVALEASAYPYCALQDILGLADGRSEPPFLLILDALQDPQNLGTLLRTAEGVGVHGVLLPLRQTVTVTPAVVSASSGACEHLLIAQANLALAIQALKEAGVWVVGLEGGGQAERVDRVRLDGPLALVVGSEGQGMRPLTRDSCDVLVQLPMRGRVESLNAAVAGSIALYLAWRARGFDEE